MTQFEFLSVFISIVLAFGVSDILSSWGEQVRLRNEIRHYWLHIVWGFLVLIVMVQAWWGLWRLRDRTEWLFSDYLLLIAPYLLLSFIAYVLTPSIKEGKTDIKRYYYDNSRWFLASSRPIRQLQLLIHTMRLARRFLIAPISFELSRYA